MIQDMLRVLERDLEGLAREVEMFPDDESVWNTAPGVSNSAGSLAFHLGQAGYLRRIVTEDARSSGPISVRELVDG